MVVTIMYLFQFKYKTQHSYLTVLQSNQLFNIKPCSHVKHVVVVRMLSVCCAVLDCRQLSHCKPEVGQDITLATQYVLYRL